MKRIRGGIYSKKKKLYAGASRYNSGELKSVNADDDLKKL